MSRKLRRFDDSGYIHIVLRGNDQQNIFFDDMDRHKMMKEIKKYCDESSIDLIAYCLMDNHIHIILHDDNFGFSDYMKKIEIAYARYFNAKYDHCGHLFQDRFYSNPITSDSQLLCAVRYVHLNPQKAGICSINHYPWSSYDEYMSGRKFCHTTQVIEMFDDISSFEQFHAFDNGYKYEGPKEILKDCDAKAIIREVTGLDNPTHMRLLEKNSRDLHLSELKALGLSIRQISRITGISKGVIQRA